MRRGVATTAAVFLILIAAAAALAAGDGSSATPEVRLTEFRIDAPSTLRAGETELVVRNSGRIDHDLVIVRTNRAAGDLPIGLNGVAPQLAGKVVFGAPHSGHDKHGGAPRHHYAPGSSKKSAVTLTPGRYVLLCSLSGHYMQGQRTSLEVRGG